MFITDLGFLAYKFIPRLFTYICAMAEITFRGLLVNSSNHILVLNQAPMMMQFLTMLETPSLDVKLHTRNFDRRRSSKATLDGDLQVSFNSVIFYDSVVCIVKSFGVLDTFDFSKLYTGDRHCTSTICMTSPSVDSHQMSLQHRNDRLVVELTTTRS